MLQSMKRITILLLAVLLLSCAFACGREKTVEEKATFDFTDASGSIPRGWEIDSYEGAYQTTLEDGTFSISTRIADDCRLIRTVSVEPETRYVLTAEMRTQSVRDGQGATLSIDNYSIDGSYLYSEGVYGDSDWTAVTLAFRTAKGQDSVVLALRLGGYSAVSSGTVWFRNVAFEASDNAPVAFQNLTPTESASTKGERSQEDYENLFTVIFWAGAIAAIVLLFGFRRRAKTLETMTEPVARRTLIFWLLVLIGLLVRLVLCAKLKGHATDIRCWPGWGAKVATQGTHAFYVDNWCDYPPGYMLVCALLWRIASLFENGPEALRLFVYMAPAFVCDVVSGALILHERKRFGLNDRLALLLAGLIVLNPAAVWLSGAWGQIDSVLTVMLIGTFLLLNASREKPWYRLLAGLLYGVAILMKWQALIFGPVLALMYVMTGVDQAGTKRFGLHVLWSVAAVLGALLMLLFGSLLFRGEGMSVFWMVERYMSASSGYDYATVEAYNLFALLGANWTKAGSAVFNGANVGGMLLQCNELFSKLSLLVLLPTLVLRAWNAMRTRKEGERNTALRELLYALLVVAILAVLRFLLKQAGDAQGTLKDVASGLYRFPLYGVFSALYLWYLADRDRNKRRRSDWLKAGGCTVTGWAAMLAALGLCLLLFTMGVLSKLFGFTLSYRLLGTLGIVLAGLMTAALFVLYWVRHRAANYSIYVNRGLIFLLAACFCVWVFTLGHYMHERYIFPALFLLLFAYAYDRDANKLAAFCMLTVTTFLNEMTAMYVVSDGAIDLIRGGTLHNEMIALISLLEVAAAVYLTAGVFLKAFAFDPSEPCGTGQKRERQTKAGRR